MRIFYLRKYGERYSIACAFAAIFMLAAGIVASAALAQGLGGDPNIQQQFESISPPVNKHDYLVAPAQPKANKAPSKKAEKKYRTQSEKTN